MTVIIVAAYCRVSTDKSDQANSLESQRLYFEQYIKNNQDWTLKEIYYDDGISGTLTEHRDGFNRMICDAMNGEIDLIITKEVSRFARNTVDTLAYTRKLKDKNIGVYFITDNINTMDKDGELRLSIIATIAQEESRKTSERVKWGQQRRMEQGIVFGRDLLGYTVKNGKLFLNPLEAETVRLIYHKFLDEGKGTHVIARELSELGIRPKRVREWSNTVILRILHNEKYAGDLCQKKTYTPNFLNHKKKYNKGNEEMVYIKDHHEPIIQRQTWNNVQLELARRSLTAEQKSKYSNRYWCSGKLICGECGRRFVSRTKKLNGGNIYKAWRCFENAMHGKPKTDETGNRIGCTNGSVNEKTLAGAVAYCLKIVQINCNDIKAIMLKEIRSVQQLDITSNTDWLKAELIKLQKKKSMAIELVLDGTLTKEELTEQKACIDRKISEVSEKITLAESNIELCRSKFRNMDEYIAEIDRIMQFDLDNGAVYGWLVEKIVVSNEKRLTVFLKKIPFGIKLIYSAHGKGDEYRTDFTFKGIETIAE